MEPTPNPFGNLQKEIPRSSPNNWSALHSLFNLPTETDDPTPEPESPTASEQIAGNWSTLKSLFGVTQPPTHPPIDPPVPPNPSNLSITTLNQAVHTAQQAANRAIQAETNAEVARQAVQNVVETVGEKSLIARESAEIARGQAIATQRTAEVVTSAAEVAKSEAELAQRAAATAQTNADITQANAAATQKDVETIKTEVKTFHQEINSAHHLTETKLMLELFKEHKGKILLALGALAAIALLPTLLLLLNQLLLFTKPGLPSIFVNPVKGDDRNNGSQSAPFKTLAYALKHAGAESSIYLAKGEYHTQELSAIPAGVAIVIQPFNDIDGHWAAPFIRALANQGMIAGYPDGSFKPDATLTRAEYATLLTQIFKLPETSSIKNFTDVSPNFWAYGNIQKAYSSQFLKGFPEGNFNPNEDVQRVQVIAALASGLKAIPADNNVLSIYEDSNNIPEWAQDQVAAATTKQIVANYPNPKQLSPTRSASRAETIVMLYQALVASQQMPIIHSPYIVTLSTRAF